MQPTIINPIDVLRALLRHPVRWIVPAVLVAAAAAAYAVVRPDTWDASQALILRNEAVNNQSGLGKFGHTAEMKAVQETILELARSRGVLRGALEEVGPPADYRHDPSAWPTPRDVADLRDTVRLTPPNGAEFGTTEVFYLHVRATDRDRALALTRAITNRLELRFQAIRDQKAQGMIEELTQAVRVARADLTEANERLSAIERKVGGDLAELRALEDSSSDDSTLRQSEMQIRQEIRQVQTEQRNNAELRDLLEKAEHDPDHLVAAPSSLLASQPGLSRLKDGLVDAQIDTATLSGRLSDEHPLMKAAIEAEREVRRNLHAELAIALRGLESEDRTLAQRESMLGERLAGINARLDKLAGLRAEYASELAATNHRGNVLREAEDTLADARAGLASAQTASLIGRIGTAETGVNPVGPGRSMIVLAGGLGGLILGFGIVFLTVDLQPAPRHEASARSIEPVQAVPEPIVPAIEPARPNVAATPTAREVRAPRVGASQPVSDIAPMPALGLSFKDALHKVGCGAPVG